GRAPFIVRARPPKARRPGASLFQIASALVAIPPPRYDPPRKERVLRARGDDPLHATAPFRLSPQPPFTVSWGATTHGRLRNKPGRASETRPQTAVLPPAPGAPGSGANGFPHPHPGNR